MSEINRGLDHMANQLRDWSPGRAVLSPDPGGLNRALDRAAAEHLREVAPHLASCLSCQAGLCAEHGPTVTAGGLVCRNCGGAGRYAGATDPRDGTIEWLACPCTAPAPPQPERTAETCFCGHCEYERDRRESPPAPPAEAKGEMTPPHGIRCDRCLAGVPHERDRHCYSIAQLMEHIAALRTRAREAESFAAHWIARAATVLRERDEAREQREDLANEILAERSDLAAANARAEKAERHNLWWSNRTKAAEDERDAREAQRAACYADLTTERAARVAAEAERDRLRECHRTAAETVWEVSVARTKVEKALAAAEAEVKRRDEYPHPCLICFGVRPASGKPCACNGTNNVYTAFDYLNAEAARLRLAYDDPTTDATDGAHPAWWRGSDAGVAGAVRIINEALDGPLPLVGCVGGADLEAVRQRVAALRASVARLVGAGNEARDILNAILDNQYTYRERVDAVDRWVARWAAAKAGRALDASAGSEARK